MQVELKRRIGKATTTASAGSSGSLSDIQNLLKDLGIDLRDEETQLWKEVMDEWPPLKCTQPAMRVEPLFDLLTGEVYGCQCSIDNARKSMGEGLGFLTIPPGFTRGVHFDTPEGGFNFAEASKENVISLAKVISQPIEGVGELLSTEQDGGVMIPKRKIIEVDALIADATLDFIPQIRSSKEKDSLASSGLGTTWAKAVDVRHIPTDYEAVVGELAHPFPFELDPFQKQAIYHLERGESVFVAAHTSAGKTAIAEYSIALARKHMTKAIYTSPIKALSNQKFRDFRTTFGDVGLLTGDVQLNPDASCLIMTTEILRSMLYRGADLIADVEFVIFDEVHYVNDQERGVVWEEVIIMLPSHVTLIMLSATIPNTLEFADWVGRTKRKNIFVVSTLTRPVPLEHFLYVDRDELVKVVDHSKTFLEAGYKKALQLQRGGSRPTVGAVAPKNLQGGIFRGVKQERGLWTDVIFLLKKRKLLPAVVFTFSKRKCEENADGLANMDLTGSSEKSATHVFLEGSVAKLRLEDRKLPQIVRLREMLARGIAVHHSGLLPIMKEAVEILFARGLVKVLFATETFAMGVNMPAKTVVFSSIRKHDGNNFRTLLPGEYTQMAGRAGRRGLDETGTVIITCPEEIPGEAVLRQMISGQATKLTSRFRLTYTMLLNLLRVEALRVEEMIKRSFGEHAGQKDLPLEQERLIESEALLAGAETLTCPLCEIDLAEFYSAAVTILDQGRIIYEHLLVDSKMVTRLLEPGRIILISNGIFSNLPAVVLRLYNSNNRGPSLSCLVLWNQPSPSSPSSAYPAGSTRFGPLPLPPLMINWPEIDRPLCRETLELDYHGIVLISKCKIRVPNDLGSTSLYRPKDLDEIQDELVRWISNKPLTLEEVDIPNFRSIEIDEKKFYRIESIKRLPQYFCTKCPELKDHYGIFHQRRLLMERLAELQFRLSDNSLVLLPEYHARVALLKTLGYIDQGGNVQVKGRVACELNTVDELVTTELLFDNAFANLEPAEIVALLSTMVFQERHSTEPVLVGRLKEGVESLQVIANRLDKIQREHGIDTPPARIHIGLVEVVYQWARGTPFTTITALTDVLEGSIVRCIVRLDETCRELRGAARTMGDHLLYKKMEEASLLIKRDICFATSLYI